MECQFGPRRKGVQLKKGSEQETNQNILYKATCPARYTQPTVGPSTSDLFCAQKIHNETHTVIFNHFSEYISKKYENSRSTRFQQIPKWTRR